MLVCLVADIHGNLPALEIVLQNTKDVDLYVSIGDVVNYGPWSNECVDLLDTLDRKILLSGNHEQNFIKKKYLGTNKIAQAFHDFCIQEFKRYGEIKSYLDEVTILDYRIIHTINNHRIFPDSKILPNENIIIGHSHKQFLIHNNIYKIINPGSVGQNRIHINEINYMVWDTDSDMFKTCSIVYDVEVVIKKMESMGYPMICIDYYKKKIRI